MNSFWKNKKVLVTGGGGFVGSHLVEELVSRGSQVSVMGSMSERSKENLKKVLSSITLIYGNSGSVNDATKACRGQDIIMNLAARVGGIEYNRTHQATMLRDNLNIASSMIEGARRANVERFLVVSSACIYPRECKVPTPETEGFVNEPEPTNGGYGWAKRMAEKLGMYYAEEYGMKVGIVRPYNCYGPRDHFEPEVSHVIPALIRRVVSGEDPVLVWGTGKQTRAFLYVDDLVEGMLQAIELFPSPDPINLGTDEEITIKDLITMIVKLSGKNPKIVFDTMKPDGSPRRNSDNTKVIKNIGFRAKVTMEEGLKRTIKWYLSHLK